MIPRLRPPFGPAEYRAALARTSTVADFENAFAALMGTRQAIAFPYGRTALMMLFESLGLKNREIICPAYTCVVVAHAIVLSGNVPVFVDSEPDGFNMDLDRAGDAVTERTGAIIATSIHGYPVDLDRLSALCARFPHVEIIQDCAHSFAAEWQGRPVQKAGRAAIFGLNVSKIMSSVFGGMVTTDDEELAERLRGMAASRLVPAGPLREAQRLAYLAASSLALAPMAFTAVDRIRRAGLIDRFTEYYSDDAIDMPADHLVGLTRVEASVGTVQCRRYERIVAHRRCVAAVYDEALKPFPKVRRAPLVEGATYSHYVARVAAPDELTERTRAAGVELGRVIDYSIPDMKAYRSYSPDDSDFSQTRRLNASVVNLPVWVDEPTARDIAAIVGARA